MYGKHRLPGRLFVVEGIDGSGKSTQLMLLNKWLESEGCGLFQRVEFVAAGAGRHQARQEEKDAYPHDFQPDSRHRLRSTGPNTILSAPQGGRRGFADRYVYTAFARDVVRGVSPKWVRDLYAFAVKPTIAFYFRTPLDVAMKRILGGRDAIKYYEAGMDLGLRRH